MTTFRDAVKIIRNHCDGSAVKLSRGPNTGRVALSCESSDLSVTIFTDAEASRNLTSAYIHRDALARAVRCVGSKPLVRALGDGLLGFEGAFGRYSAQTIEGEDVFDWGNNPLVERTAECQAVQDVCRIVSHAVQSENTFRPAMSNILFDEGMAIGTDAHRMRAAPGIPGWDGLAVNCLDLTVASRCQGVISVAAVGHYQLVKSARMEIARRVTESQFPNWRRAVPAPEDPFILQFDRDALLKALRAVAPVAKENARRVRFVRTPDGQAILVQAGDTDCEYAEAVLESRLPVSVNLPVTGFNCAYLADAIRWMGQEVTFSFEASTKPALIQTAGATFPNSGFAVVMPMATEGATASPFAVEGAA